MNRARTGAASAQAGSAVVDFVLVGALVCVLFAALLQLGLALHVRNTLTWAASEGARAGSRMDAAPEDGARRTRELITESLSGQYATDVTTSRRVEGGVAIVEIRVQAPVPVVGLWGPPDMVTTRGRAFAEDQR
ncbi:MAG: pilus assembly protein [Austwickia sp.]|nr:pilus assembly protein [Austwickia sp.]